MTRPGATRILFAMGWRAVTAVTVASVMILGCKKPQVEVEEDGPPLPLPPSGQPGQGPGPNAGLGPNPGQPTAGDPRDQEPGPSAPGVPQIALDTEQACRIIDAHMQFHNVDIADRVCSNLRQNVETIRLNRYYVKGPNNRQDAYNFCLWPEEKGDGWRVGYVDGAMQPCRDQDLYCKAGAPNRVRRLSWRACPGDREHAIINLDARREQLVGRWRQAGDEDRPDINLEIGADSSFLWRGDGKPIKGRFELIDTTRMRVLTDKGPAFDIGYALVDGGLHLKAHAIVAPATDPEAFLAILNPNRAIRRFRGACYEIAEPARETPNPVKCEIRQTEIETLIDIRVDENFKLTLIRKGEFWMDGNATASRFEKVGSPAQLQ